MSNKKNSTPVCSDRYKLWQTAIDVHNNIIIGLHLIRAQQARAPAFVVFALCVTILLSLLLRLSQGLCQLDAYEPVTFFRNQNKVPSLDLDLGLNRMKGKLRAVEEELRAANAKMAGVDRANNHLAELEVLQEESTGVKKEMKRVEVEKAGLGYDLEKLRQSPSNFKSAAESKSGLSQIQTRTLQINSSSLVKSKAELEIVKQTNMKVNEELRQEKSRTASLTNDQEQLQQNFFKALKARGWKPGEKLLLLSSHGLKKLKHEREKLERAISDLKKNNASVEEKLAANLEVVNQELRKEQDRNASLSEELSEAQDVNIRPRMAQKDMTVKRCIEESVAHGRKGSGSGEVKRKAAVGNEKKLDRKPKKLSHRLFSLK